MHCRLTKRAPDVWESARFTGIFPWPDGQDRLAQASIVHARPTQVPCTLALVVPGESIP
jgi:hypothetical protein